MWSGRFQKPLKAYWPQSEIDLQRHESNWGTRGQKGDVWDGGHRIPLIISWPSRVKDQIVYDHLVSLTDLFATFADLTGQKPQQNSGEDSFSFLHVLNGNTSKITRPSMVHQSSGDMFSIRMDGNTLMVWAQGVLQRPVKWPRCLKAPPDSFIK